MLKQPILTLLLFSSLSAMASDIDMLASEARALSKSFAGQLKQQLQQGMKQGGALHALDVCNVEAPVIANAVGNKAGWKIRRTSLKARHENNRPDMWELTTLLNFEKQKDAGTKIAAMESFSVVNSDRGKVFRYMRAIPTGGLCLNCHGNDVQDDVLAKIHQLYPADQALDFNVGDIRGAFTLSKEID